MQYINTNSENLHSEFSYFVHHRFMENTLFLANKDHLFSNLGEESVVLSIKSGKYYGLNTVGTTIWQALENPISFREIQQILMREYDVNAEDCAKELNSFLENLIKEGLVEVVHETDKQILVSFA